LIETAILKYAFNRQTVNASVKKQRLVGFEETEKQAEAMRQF
jgi:hypothetical protein